ncbi:Pc22g15020 [Penicillium rubens Wisconsin 54-1255]|uniref:Pc22g15020 protein n=2 Tax=Penicillium chrysogenum species complex TaxID=254878 RepID=B6HVM1_PENRW|nr:Pc22g15020 [Penicillium rubens Wisconsin 54-1255]
MANQQRSTRRNGVIGFQMAGAPTPAIPSLNNQGPPHGITPLVGPDTARSSPLGVRPRQTSRGVTALSASLADAEATISRQESEQNNTGSQVSALRSQVATHRTTRFVDQAHIDALINRSYNDRARDIDRQFRILEDRLDQVSEEHERAEGNKAALQGLQYALQKDRHDVQDLRQIVAAAEFNLQRQQRLAGAEDRMKGLARNLNLMLAAAMQATRDSQVRARSAPTAESTTNPVGIARRHVVGSQEPGSHGHASDFHPQELGKGKARDPGPLLSEGPGAGSDAESVVDDGDCSMRSRSESPSVLSDVMSLDSRRSSRASSPKGQELAAAPLQEDGSQDTMELVTDEDVDMDWDEEPVITINQDALAAPSQASGEHAFPPPSSTVEENAVIVPGLASNAAPSLSDIARPDPSDIARPDPSDIVIPDAPVEPLKPAKSRGRPHVRKQYARNARYQPYQRRSVRRVRRTRRTRRVRRVSPTRPTRPTRPVSPTRPTRPVSPTRRARRVSPTRRARRVPQMAFESVNMPVRKRTAGVDNSSGDEPTRKKRATDNIIASNGSRLLAISDSYTCHTAVKVEVPVMSVPAVTQPAQTDFKYTEGVSTEQVPTEAAMSEPAVSKPTQAASETTEQVLPASALSEPAVPKPAQADSDEIDTLKTEQVLPASALSEPAVPEPTQAAPEPTSLRVNVSDDVLGVPAPSEPAQIKSAHATPLWTERVRRVHVVPEPTLSGSDRAVPSEWTDTQSRTQAMPTMRFRRVERRPNFYKALKGLQVTATSRRRSTSSLVASPEDASAENAVATGADSRAGVSEGAKRVEDAEDPNCSAQKTAGNVQEEMGGEDAATSGLQMPGAWPSDPPVITASGESDMHEGSDLLRVLWTGTRWASFGVFAMVMVTLLSSPLWLGHLEHLAYAFEGPEKFLEELREEYGYVPLLEWIIHVILRSFAGDRTLFG